MQHPHEVDMVLAILDTQEIMVYGDRGALWWPMERTCRRRWPESRLSSAATSSRPTLPGSVTWAKVLEAGRQIPRLERVMAADPHLNQE